jgi:hypothetical protein
VLIGRSIQLWTNLVQTLVALVVAGAAWQGNEIPAAIVAALTGAILALLGLLANQSATGTLLGRAPVAAPAGKRSK